MHYEGQLHIGVGPEFETFLGPEMARAKPILPKPNLAGSYPDTRLS